ncbi:histidinol dehydrogenase [Jiangella rhizosphaerae]|uniref:Histidinol dehydrogenase n=1 Tax=Jiangella rhizosphaerae TaxID=2293569 RepID=A0A418KJG1_9ACTN|nr:histidinol dehydrogenase [Jiangella rhizosphaerae]RIQ13726.1 histidinol dehydrogenase [Jiangella rhizosphaerae]
MIRRIDLRGRLAAGESLDYRTLVPRAPIDVEAALDAVRPICDDVRHRGLAAVKELTARFDGVELTDVRVPQDAIDSASERLDPRVRSALEESIRRARLVHGDQRRTDVTTTVVPGGTVTERWIPVERVGLYVPGGLAVYPSSVVMNVVPAQVAGVGSLAVASPPQRDTGLPHPTILAACALLGVTEVYAVGGAQALAMFAYGIQGTVEPVDLVTGPGNVYVAAAKRLLRGVVGIDAEAGPTEIAVLADDTADPRHVAADLISQAEHDPLAASVLVTDSEALADAVTAELDLRTKATKHDERVRTALSGEQSGIVLVDDLEQGLAVVDAYAAEHLEIQTRDAAAVAAKVKHAGAVFVGPWSPVSLGDYAAGSNHVLPTGGSARHSSGLSVQTFLRGVHVVHYDEAALRDIADDVRALANAEDLPAHGEAIAARFGDE